MMMTRYCVVLYLVVGLCSCFGMDGDDAFVLNFDSPVYVCPDDASKAFVDAAEVEVARHNETVAFLRGSFAFLQTVDQCMLLELIIEKSANGRTEVLVTHEICDFCAELSPESNYRKYFKYFGFNDACPLEPGSYTIHDFVTDSDDLPVNGANQGYYQLTLNFYQNPECDCKDNREFKGCLKLDFLIEPL